MRFRKSISICKGVKLNISKSGPSLTVGRKGVSFNVGGKGAYVNWSIPGTGVYDRVRVDTLVKDKLLGGDKSEKSGKKSGSLLEGVLGGAGGMLASVLGGEPESKTKAKSAGAKTEPKSGKTAASKKTVAKDTDDGVSEALLEEIAQEEAFVAIAKAAPDVERKADGGALREQEADRAIEAWFGEAESPVPFEIQTECISEKKAIMVDLDLPEIEDMPNRKLVELASGAVKVKEKSQKEQRETYQTCVLGLGEFVSAHMLNIVPSAEQIIVSAYTRRRDTKTGEGKDVFVYSIVFERKAFKKGYQKQEPQAFCGTLRGRFIVLASGLMKEIAPFDPEEV